jgi:hypothetical protein
LPSAKAAGRWARERFRKSFSKRQSWQFWQLRILAI